MNAGLLECNHRELNSVPLVDESMLISSDLSYFDPEDSNIVTSVTPGDWRLAISRTTSSRRLSIYLEPGLKITVSNTDDQIGFVDQYA